MSDITGANLARFWELRGEPVFEAGGVFWGKKKGPFYASLPFERTLDLEADGADRILRESRVFGVRFPALHGNGIDSGLYACNPAEYGMHAVCRKQRGHIRHGLDHCEIRRIDGEELASRGFELNHETLERQHRCDERLLDPSKWQRLARAVRDCPGAMAWGAFFEGRLSTYIIGCRDGDCLNLMFKASRTADLEQYSNHALDYSIVMEAAQDPGIRLVTNGSTSLARNEGLDRYKRQMGYSVLAQKHAIHLHPMAAPLLRSALGVAIAQKLHDRYPENKKLFYAAHLMDGARLTREPMREGESSQMPDAAVATAGCQQEDPRFSTLARPGVLFPILRAVQTFRQGGIAYTAKRASDFLSRRVSKKKPAAAVRAFVPDEVLGLQPGEWVEVKSLAEIQATLDARKKTRGLLFTDEMLPYVGKRFRVHKRVESIFLEESKQRRTIKNTVLLEQSFCGGKNFNCDRSCFLFWKEVWLKRTGEQPSAVSAHELVLLAT